MTMEAIGSPAPSVDHRRLLQNLHKAANDASTCLNATLRDGARQRALEMLEPVFTLLRVAQDKTMRVAEYALPAAALQLRAFVRECLGGTREFGAINWSAIDNALRLNQGLSLDSASL